MPVNRIINWTDAGTIAVVGDGTIPATFTVANVAGSDRALVLCIGVETGTGVEYQNPTVVEIRDNDDNTLVATASLIVSAAEIDKVDYVKGGDRSAHFAVFNESAVAAIMANGGLMYVSETAPNSDTTNNPSGRYAVYENVDFAQIVSNAQCTQDPTNLSVVAPSDGVALSAMLSSTIGDTITWSAPAARVSDWAYATETSADLNLLEEPVTAGTVNSLWSTSGTAFNPPHVLLALPEVVVVNQAPVLNEDLTAIQVQADQVTTISADITDPDVGDTLAWTITPDITLVNGFGFNSSNGDITTTGAQTVAGAIAYTRRATDTEGLFAEDTFTIEVVPPALVVTSVSDTTPAINTQITAGHSNALATLTTPNFNIASQNGTQAVIDIPDITTFVLAGQTFPTINFLTAVSIPLSDGTNSANVELVGIENPAGTLFGEITSIDPNGRYAPTVEIQPGHFGYFFNINGNWTIDPATGAASVDAAGGSLQFKIYNGEWGAASPVYTVAARPAGQVSIDSLVEQRNGAVISWSYPGVDLTGFQYRINGGSWIAATSPLTITGQNSDATYLFEVTAVNNGRIGDIASQSYTTQDAIDTTPNDYTLNPQSPVARSVFVTSNTITVQGVDAGVDIPVTVNGGEYSVSTDSGATWGAWTSANTNVRLNYQVRVRHLSAATYNTPANTDLSIGGVSRTFTSTTLVDAVAPVISLTGGNMSIVEGNAFVEPGYSAIDNADGDISVTGVVVTGSVNHNVPGVYTLTYTATDAAGNSSATTRTVTVTAFVPGDTQAPSISLIGGNRTLNEGDTWSEPGYTATDNVDGNITNSVVVTGSVNTSVPGVYTLTYTATDAAGNTGSVTRTVTVLAAIQYPIDSPAPSSRTFVAERLNRIEKGEAVFIKQPEEILDYDFDLTDWLASQPDTLQAGAFSVESGDLTVLGSGIIPGTSRVKVWLGGGAAGRYGTAYPVELTIITTGFRTAKFLLRIVVIDRVQ